MPTATSDWVGVLLTGNRYQVTAKLGEGGMGHVYRAHDRNLDAEVVIKVPRRSMMEDPEFAGRFAREIRSLVRLVHPHIVKVMDVGEQDELPFAVMQYLSGGSLRDRQQSGTDGKPAPMPPHDLRGWLEAVATALDFIHSKGYVHRDVKPDNVLFDAQGHAYLSDFGVAKVLADQSDGNTKTVMTGAGMVLGTPQFMAPELIMGQPYDGRVDQYALAVMVYELVSGRYPFDGPNSAAIFMQHMSQEAAPLESVLPSIPKDVAAAVHRGLAKDPGERFPDCASFARAVLAAIGQSPAPTGKASSPKIKVTCPGCQKVIGVPIAAQGKRLRCPACGTPFQAPERATHQAVATGRGEQAKIDTKTVGVSRPPPTSSPGAATNSRLREKSTARILMQPGKVKGNPRTPRARWLWVAGIAVCALLVVSAWFVLNRQPTRTPRTGKPEAQPVPWDIPLAMLRERFAGKATYNPGTGELSLVYDFNEKSQLKDFDAGKSSPVVGNGNLQMDGGESITHVVKFKNLVVSGVIVINNYDGAIESPLRTTGGFGFSCGGQNGSYAKVCLLAGDKALVEQGFNCDEVKGKAIAFELKVNAARANLSFGNINIGKGITENACGQVVLSAPAARTVFGKLVISGTLDPEWAKTFFEVSVDGKKVTGPASNEKAVAGKPEARPVRLDIPSARLREKFAGQATYDPGTGELSLIYDFKEKSQLKDFDAGKSEPVIEKGSLQMDGGESITHVVKFKNLVVSGLIVISNFDGAIESPLRTTGGFGFSCGGQNGSYARMRLLANDKVLAEQGFNCDEVKRKPIAFELKVNKARANFTFANINMGKGITENACGQVVLSAPAARTVFGKLVISGTLDPEWAKTFFGP